MRLTTVIMNKQIAWSALLFTNAIPELCLMNMEEVWKTWSAPCSTLSPLPEWRREWGRGRILSRSQGHFEAHETSCGKTLCKLESTSEALVSIEREVLSPSQKRYRSILISKKWLYGGQEKRFHLEARSSLAVSLRHYLWGTQRKESPSLQECVLFLS